MKINAYISFSRLPCFALSFGLCLLLVCNNLVAATVVVAPGAFEHAEGDSGVLSPFGFLVNPPSSMRYQQVFDTSQFSEISPGGGFITDIAFRVASQGSAFSATLPNIQINLSTTTKAPDGLSLVFSENVGADDKVVLGPGSLKFQAPNFDTMLPPNFAAGILLSSPFYYNPQAGNLLLDIRYNQTMAPPFIPGLVPSYLDATGVTGDSVSRVLAVGVDSLSGQADSYGLITAFAFTPVPEPSTMVIVLLGFVALGIVRQKRLLDFGKPRA